MRQQHENTQQLSDFVSTHELRNRQSVTHFNALVDITTAQNKLVNQSIQVMISFDNFDSYGQVVLLTGDLDPLLYPTTFDGKWPNTRFEHIDSEFLKISDFHTRNAAIGQYSVKIIPLSRIRD